MPRHTSPERKREKERSRDREREPKRSSRKDSPHEEYEKKNKSSKSYHKDDYHGDESGSKSSKRDSKHHKDDDYENSSSNRDNRSGTAEETVEGSSKSRKRDRHGSPVRIDNDYHHDKLARTKRTVKNHDVYEAVSEDENDGLMSNDDSKRRDSKKKKSTREDKPSSSEVPKRRVFYDSEDQPSEKEVPKDAKKPKKDREYEQVEEKTSRKRSSSPREKKSKRDDSSKRERERPASETSEEEKQKLRREKAKNFTERLREESPSIVFQFGDVGVSKLSSADLAVSAISTEQKKSMAVDPVDASATSTNDANLASQWVAVTTDTEHLFTKQVVNDRVLPQSSSSSKSKKSDEAKVRAASAAKVDDDRDDEIYDPTLPTDDYDVPEDKRAKTPPKSSEKKKTEEKSSRADLYDGVDEAPGESRHGDSSSDRKRRKRSEERKERYKEEREKEDSRHSSSRRKEKDKVLDDNLYENEPFSPEYEGDFSRRDSSRSKDNSRSRRSSPSRDSHRSSKGDRSHESRDRDAAQSRNDYKDYHSYSYRRGSGEESRRDERYPLEDSRGGRDDYSHASRRSRNGEQVSDERSQQSSSRRGDDDRERRESVGIRGADISADDKFKHPGSPVDPQYKRRSHRDSYEHQQSNSDSKHYRDRSSDSGGSRPPDEANGSGGRRYSSSSYHYRQDSRHEAVEVVGYRPPPSTEEGPRSSSGSRHYRDVSPTRMSSSRDTEEETGDLEKLESELKDFGGVNEDGSRIGAAGGRKRDRSPDDADIDVPNPSSSSIYPTNSTPMKMSEFAHLPKQFGWPRLRDERNLGGVRGLSSSGATSQHKSQKEAFSAEAIMSKYNLKKNLSASTLSSGSSGASVLTSSYDKFRGLNNLLHDLSCSEFATGSKADLKLREEIQNCSSLSLTVSATHPMFKMFKSLSKSFLVKNYEVDAK
ncbi:uncharacterized protein LOC142349205 isoform X2 [Convolutriloba macropyga]|uniref:uncharacterized protein LOC142349205 isoform X2 n=1 Tax=Convolutriloba macropyga TaxID=536237 RepID=UPI003F51D40C